MPRSLKIFCLLTVVFLTNSIVALEGESIFIKALAGGGYSYVTQKDEPAGTGLTFTGPLGISMLQAGGSLSKSVKFYGFTGFSYGPSPKVKAENLKIDTVYDYFYILDLGLGLAYHTKGGQTLSLGGSIAQNYYKYSVYGAQVGTFTRHGWGAHLIAGQEFPLSARFSWGLSAILYYGRVSDVGPSADAPVTNLYGGIAVSLMYD